MDKVVHDICKYFEENPLQETNDGKKINMVTFLQTYNPSPERGFMLTLASEHPGLEILYSKIDDFSEEYDIGHSGASFAFTCRQIQAYFMDKTH